jgi:hypothetical protein
VRHELFQWGLLFHVSLFLLLRHLPEILVSLQQIGVGALVNDFAVFHVEDDVAVHNGCEAVADHDDSAFGFEGFGDSQLLV